MTDSNLHPRKYKEKEINRICNREQQTFYIDSGAYPIDLYTSYAGENENEKKIIVMVFDRKDTKELYTEWKNRDRENNK